MICTGSVADVTGFLGLDWTRSLGVVLYVVDRVVPSLVVPLAPSPGLYPGGTMSMGMICTGSVADVMVLGFLNGYGFKEGWFGKLPIGLANE